MGGSYGRSFSLVNMATDHGYLAATGPANDEGLFSGSEGTYSRTEGFLTYYEICENIATKGWTEVWDDDIKAPYANDNDDFKGQFCGQGPYPLLNASKREWNRPGGNGDGSPTQGPTSGPTSAHTTQPTTTKGTTQPQNGRVENNLYVHADSCQKYY